MANCTSGTAPLVQLINMGYEYVKRAQDPTERTPNSRTGTTKWATKLIKVVLGYNPKYKINIYESILIYNKCG